MEYVTQWLLVASAVGLGWLAGAYSRDSKKNKNNLSSESSERRIKLLIDSYAYKNMDSFIESLEASKESFPLHLSIARHFRKNGEVEKAISIHQNLMSRPGIPSLSSLNVTFELAKDYMAAGLFDRAESLLKELQKTHSFVNESTGLLIDLYRKESEWQWALNEAISLEWKRDQKLAVAMAQFCCEIAEQEIRKRNNREASVLLKKAIDYDQGCVRAYIDLAKFEIDQQEFEKAMIWMDRAFSTDNLFVKELIPISMICKDSLGETRIINLWKKWYVSSGSERLLIALAEYYHQQGEYEFAVSFLRTEVSKSPKLRPMIQLLKFEAELNPDHAETFHLAAQLGDLVLSQTSVYQCDHCGFSGGQLHWLCPSCKEWGRIKPSDFHLIN